MRNSGLVSEVRPLALMVECPRHARSKISHNPESVTFSMKLVPIVVNTAGRVQKNTVGYTSIISLFLI